MAESRRHLPTAWYCRRAPDGEVLTFRWGRGAGYLTVHRGDVRGEHHDDVLVDTVHVGVDWIDDNDVRMRARKWLRARVRRRAS